MNVTAATSSFLNDMEKLHSIIRKSPHFEILNKKKEIILFLSVGQMKSRANVFTAHQGSFERAWMHVQKQAFQYLKKNHLNPEFLKIDWVEKEEILSILQF